MHYNDHTDLSNMYSELVVIFPLRMPEVHLIGDEVTTGGTSSTPTASSFRQFRVKASGCGGLEGPLSPMNPQSHEPLSPMNPGDRNKPWLVTTSGRQVTDDLGG